MAANTENVAVALGFAAWLLQGKPTGQAHLGAHVEKACKLVRRTIAPRPAPKRKLLVNCNG